MAISWVAGASGTTSATMPTHQVGDLIIARAFRDGNNTAPTIPSGIGWTTIDNSAGANSNGAAIAYKIATTTTETVGTWSSATRVDVGVWRGASGIGASAVAGSAATSVDYPALGTLSSSNNWVAGFSAHRSTNTSLENAPTGMTNRVTAASGTDEGAIHDTNGGVASWSLQSVAVGGTASGWRSHTVEIVAAAATQDIAPSGIASTAAFGLPVITTGAVDVAPSGIGSTAAFGLPVITTGAVDVAPSGIASTVAFGLPTITQSQDVAPSGIGSTAAFGLPVITTGAVDVAPSGIGSTVGFGNPTVSAGAVDIAPSGIGSTAAFGLPVITTGAVDISPPSIDPTAAFGLPVISQDGAPLDISPSGIPSTAAFGLPVITTGAVNVSPNGIASTVAFGLPMVSVDQTIAPSGIASTVAFGLPGLNQFLGIAPEGIPSTVRFGTPTIRYVAKPDTPAKKITEVEIADNFLQLSLRELHPDDPENDLYKKLLNHLKIGVALSHMPQSVGITRQGMSQDFQGAYAMKESGSGLFLGLFKDVQGILKPITLPLPNEIRILRGAVGEELIPPAGWEIVDDVEIQARYNVGVSPNWIAAAIRYRGI